MSWHLNNIFLRHNIPSIVFLFNFVCSKKSEFKHFHSQVNKITNSFNGIISRTSNLTFNHKLNKPNAVKYDFGLCFLYRIIFTIFPPLLIVCFVVYLFMWVCSAQTRNSC